MSNESDPYIVQNVRLTFGSLVFNIAFLPVMGWIGEWESPPRTDLAFWHFRPIDLGHASCHAIGHCDAEGTFVLTNGTAVGHESVQCACGKGVFVGWKRLWAIYGALASGVVYSWVTGLVVKKFSSVYRSVADGIMLLVVYFALGLIFDGPEIPPWADLAKSFVVLMVPISGTTFSYAAAEMQQAFEAVRKRDSHNERREGDAESTSDVSEDVDHEESEAEASETQ